MKIVYCIPGTYRSGGMERVLSLKANWLAAHGYHVSIVTTDQRGRAPFFKLDTRINVHDLNIGYENNNGSSFFDKLSHFPKKVFIHRQRLSKFLNEIKPDICVSMFAGESFFLPTLRDGSRKIAEFHFSRHKRLSYGRKGLFGFADKMLSRVDGIAAAHYDRFIVLTKEDKHDWNGTQKIGVIANPLPFIPSRSADLEKPVALAIGRLSHQKGFDRMIEAWKQVILLHPDWTLRIIGDGELKPDLMALVEKNGLVDNIEFIPPTQNVEKHYLDASIFLLTSHYEGLPMVLLEAQSYGLPIVSMTCKCGPREVVTDGIDGFLVDNGDILTMANRIAQLIECPNLRRKMGKAAKDSSKRFDIETIMNKWDNLFKDIVNEK